MVSSKISEMAALELVGRLPDLMRGATSGSLIEYTKPTRVEPIVLLDQRAMHLPYASDIMQSLSSIFSGYYLQAVAISVNVGSVETLKLLDKLNPRRDPVGNFIGEVSSMVSKESYTHALPRPDRTVGLEAYGLENLRGGNSFGRDAAKLVQEATNLSVGKLLEVQIESDGQKATFPIAVRLIVSGIAPDSLVHSLAIGSKDNSIKERFHQWRAGQLHFIRDLVFCQDLIDDHRNNLLKDRSNFYAETLKRRNKNRLSAILSRSPSVATASSIFVLTEETRKELESQIGGRLRDFKTREKIFKETYGMLMVVVDTEWEQVTIYHRSLDTPTELSVKDLKVTNRGTGPDVMEILRAYQLGNSPSI